MLSGNTVTLKTGKLVPQAKRKQGTSFTLHHGYIDIYIYKAHRINHKTGSLAVQD